VRSSTTQTTENGWVPIDYGTTSLICLKRSHNKFSISVIQEINAVIGYFNNSEKGLGYF